MTQAFALDGPTLTTLRRRLLRWYRGNRRQLPWRASGAGRLNPYHVLVSEFMLQQTQVATVTDYFHRFILRFPHLRALAEAPEQAVLRLWQGLGYYRRARHLHAAARIIVQQHGGQVPDDLDDLMRLPGIGRYTAGAIASIAFDHPAALLDGNVARVLARLFAIDQAVEETTTRRRLWALAGTLLPSRRPGDFNQAMMELGSLVCTPRNPRCPICPLAKLCRARRSGIAQQLPVKISRRTVKAVSHHVLAVTRKGRYLFQQRPSIGLWSNMWQLPTVEHLNGTVNDVELIQWVKQSTGLAVSVPAMASAFDHQTTHRNIRVVLWRARVVGGRLRRGAGQWRRLNRVNDLPLAKPQQRALAILQQTDACGTNAIRRTGPGDKRSPAGGR